MEEKNTAKEEEYIPPYVPVEDHQIVEGVYKAPEIRMEKYI
jgi:hypothetical protein